jgi:hypothetical protein
MAEINEITLTIIPKPNSTNLFSEIRYSIQGNDEDVANELRYRQVCELIGDDTPSDGTDDVLYLVRDVTTQFAGTAVKYVYDTVLDLPRSLYDEDKSPILPLADEIRARVTLTPILGTPVTTTDGTAMAPAFVTRESNQVVLPVIAPPVNG